MKSLLILLLLLCFSSSFAFLPKSFKANFEQVRKTIISGKIKKSNGTIEYKFPGNLRLESNGNEPLLLISNSKKTWLYRPPFIKGEKGELTTSDSGDNELTGLFDVLKSGLKSGPLYRVSIKGESTKLTFTKSGIVRSGLKIAKLYFKGKQQFSNLKSIDIVQKTGKKLTLNLSSIETNVDFKAKRFSFTMPKN